MKNKNLIISFIWAALVVTAIHALNFKGSVPNFLQEAQGIYLLDVKPSFSPDETYQRLEAYGESGRSLYKYRLFTLDLALPLNVFLFLALYSQFSKNTMQFSRVGTLILIGAFGFLIFDLAENISIYTMLVNYPGRLDALATITPYFSIIKRVASLGAIFLVIASLISYLTKILRSRQLQ